MSMDKEAEVLAYGWYVLIPMRYHHQAFADTAKISLFIKIVHERLFQSYSFIRSKEVKIIEKL